MWIKMALSSLIILLLMDHSECQLIGSRGVFTLPEGMEYRDAVTREASRLVADFARMLQAQEGKAHTRRSKARGRSHTPDFGPQVLVLGRALAPTEVIDFQDSRALRPPPDQRMNRILPEVEEERLLLSSERDVGMNSLESVRQSLNRGDERDSKQFSAFQAVPTPPGFTRKPGFMRRRQRKKIIPKPTEKPRTRARPRTGPIHNPSSPVHFLPTPQTAGLGLQRAALGQQSAVVGLQPLKPFFHSQLITPQRTIFQPSSPSIVSTFSNNLHGTESSSSLMSSPKPPQVSLTSPVRIVIPNNTHRSRSNSHLSPFLQSSRFQEPSPPPTPSPIQVSSMRPHVFDRTPSSLSDINSDVVSSNVFGSRSIGSFLVEGPNYSISWG